MYVSNPLVCRMGRGVFFQFRLATGWFRSRCRPLESRSNWGRHSWLHQVSFPEDIGQRATGDFAYAMEAGMVSPASVPESSSLQTASLPPTALARSGIARQAVVPVLPVSVEDLTFGSMPFHCRA